MTITDILSRIYTLTNTNSTSYPSATMLVAINNAYNRVTSLIIKADTKWQWDDSNNTDFPIATTAIVANQKDYALSVTHLKITRVRLKDTTGTWRVLIPIDLADQDYSSIEDSTTAGVPLFYDKMAGSVLLSPTPNFSQSASIELTYQRGPNEFTSADVSTGTKAPGFNSMYHELIPLWVGYDFWLINDPVMSTRIFTKIQLLESELKMDYALRSKDDKIRMVAGFQNNK